MKRGDTVQIKGPDIYGNDDRIHQTFVITQETTMTTEYKGKVYSKNGLPWFGESSLKLIKEGNTIENMEDVIEHITELYKRVEELERRNEQCKWETKLE